MLSTREVAERLSVSEASVRRWSDRGLLPVQRVGKRRERRFRPQDVNRLAGEATPAGPSGRPGDQLLLGGRMVDIPFHLATFYDTDAGRFRLTIPFLVDGLRSGQPCVLVASGEVLDGYLLALETRGVDVETALTSGALATFPGPGRTVGEALDFWERILWLALDRNARMARGVGEMASVRDGFESEQEMLAFEAALDPTARRFPCALICQYDVRRFSGQAVLQALRAHPDILSVSLGPLLK